MAAHGRGAQRRCSRYPISVSVPLSCGLSASLTTGFAVHAAASGNTSAKLGAKVGAKGQTVQRSLSASAVFAEIMSIIKGSVAALRTQNGYLSRAEYMALPVKTGAVTGRQNFSTVST